MNENGLGEISSSIEQATKSVDQPAAPPKEIRETNAEGLPVLRTITFSPGAEKEEIAKREQDKIRDERVLENLHRLENYTHNATRIEQERTERQNKATKMAEAAELLGLGKEKAEASARELEEFEKQNFPQELIRGEILVPNTNPVTENPRTDFTEVETNYRNNIDQWLAMAREKQAEAFAQIKEENKTPEQKTAEARAKAAEQEAAQLQEQLRLANEAKEAETARANAAVEDVQRLREDAARIAAEHTPAAAVEEEPALEMEALEAVAPIDARNRFEKIRDGVTNGVKAWFHNLDPRDKDWAWRIGAITGVTESTLTSIAVIPGGRIAVSALNFLAAQGVYAGVKVAEKVTIARMANEGPVDNDQVQAILDARERYQNADHKIRNFFMGLSAGMTAGAVTSALIHGAYSLGENLLSGHDVATPVVAKAPEVVKKFVVKPFGWTPGAETFNSTVTIPDHGNFWSAWHIDTSSAANWADLHNGTTHTDVIKDMVIKLARANGHELGLVHAGDQIELAKVLTPDQLDLVRKAAAAKSYAEYSQAIRPAYHVLLKK